MTATAILRHEQSPAPAQFARIAGQGSLHHPHLATLVGANGPDATRDLADAVHLLCHLHGRHPGLIDVALSGCGIGPAQPWLSESAAQFARERLYLVRLAAAVGPSPSTPGAAQSEAALQSQRHAIETLARSERRGCALGAATALVADWGAFRPLLDRAAARAGIDAPLPFLPADASIAQVIAAAVDTAASERALLFGAEQLLLQHRAFFDLLEARAAARLD